MNKKKGPFDAALEILKAQELKLRRPFFQTQTGGPRREQIRRAIRILKDWHKWEPLIEAAGKVDIRSAQFFIDGAANFGEGLSVINSDSSRYLYQTGEKQIRALLGSLPERKEKS